MKTACLRHLAVGCASLQEAVRHGEGEGEETKASQDKSEPWRQAGRGTGHQPERKGKKLSPSLQHWRARGHQCGDVSETAEAKDLKIWGGVKNKLIDLGAVKQGQHIKSHKRSWQGEKWSCKPHESIKQSLKAKMLLIAMLTNKN